MENDCVRSVSSRATRRNQHLQIKIKDDDDEDGGLMYGEKLLPEYTLKFTWKKGFVRLILTGGIIWMLIILTVVLFHVWSCQSSVRKVSALCNRDSNVYGMLNTMGLVTQRHRCPIPVAGDPNEIVIPKRRSPEKLVEKLSYIMEDIPINGSQNSPLYRTAINGSQSTPLFGGHQTWQQREESFKIKSTMEVHCGFMEGGGGDMDLKDIEYVKKCKFVVVTGIFDAYDMPHQLSNISKRSQILFCFLMVVDEGSLEFIRNNASVREDNVGGQWAGIWRLILVKNQPYDEPRRNGKVPKILTHRLFPQAEYSIWIDSKMTLIVDPLLLLERYLWRGKHTFAIAHHKHHRSIYEEADSNKRRKRYARPLVDLHMKIYLYEGMKPWNPQKGTWSDVPEGAIIIREHTPLTNLASCLWFNEVHQFTPRDQLSFGYINYRLGGMFKFFMFPNCEYNSIFSLHPHIRKHSSKIEWAKSMDELRKHPELIERKGGLGLWTYPRDLALVVLPPVARTSKAG